MKTTFVFTSLLLACMALPTQAQTTTKKKEGTGLTIPNKSYAGAVDFTNAPKRRNNRYPLSDQKNTEGWVKQKKYCDEFKGKELDLEKWSPSARGWIGREPTYFHANNIEVKDGYAVFSINQHGDEQLPEGYTHSSGFIKSHATHLYGYYEARLKPNKSPWVTGFWMSYGDKDWWTEIDICENCPFMNNQSQDLNSNVHVFRAPEDKGNVKEHFSLNKKYYIPFNLADDFHTWGIDWTEEYIRFYLDGVLFREVENTHWHQPLNVNINNESNKWFGALPDDRYVDEKYLVDYFRVWKRK